ncbi:MAG: hypothetical protein K0R24_2024, partial [Gammaproteobacteria bacterium]|nr:hypothetical protein [Gammaproteobacteria bacterium]
MAKEKLHTLENNVHTPNLSPKNNFSVTPENPVIELLKNIHPDQLSPREALELLYQLKKKSEF